MLRGTFCAPRQRAAGCRMQMVFDLISPPHARRSDPATSHAAAERAQGFAASQRGRIYLALIGHGPMTAKELVTHIVMTDVQVCRRLPELQRLGLVRPLVEAGRPVVRDGSRVWEACA